MHVFVITGKVVGALPGADILEYRPCATGLVVHRCPPDRLEQIASRGAGECAKGDRGVWHPECGVAYVWHRPAQQIGHNGQRIQVGELPWSVAIPVVV